MAETEHASNPDQLMAHALGVCWHSPTSDRWPCTPAGSSPPPRDGEVCTCPSGDGSLRWPCPRHLQECLAAAATCPIALPEPPAADSPTPGTDALRHNLIELCDSAADGTVPVAWVRQLLAAPSPVDTTEPAAETQQDDERERAWAAFLAGDHKRHWSAFRAGWDAALATRPSADAETLRTRVLAVVDALDEVCEPGTRNLVDAPTVSRAIRAALDGER